MDYRRRTSMYFDELWRVNVRRERGRVDSIGTQETLVPQKVDVSEHLDKLDLTTADLRFLWELGIKV
jgi:hypothetical protein